MSAYLSYSSLSRILGETLFVIAVVTFLAGNIAFYFIIGDNEFSKHVMSTIVALRVILLDGLFLVMGIILGVCIIIVSNGKDPHYGMALVTMKGKN